MPNRNYEAGRRFEYRVKKDLEKSGHVVIRSAGSHSMADLVAFHEHYDGRSAFIQCKLHGAMTKKEMEAFCVECSKLGVQSIIAENIKGKITYKRLTLNNPIQRVYIGGPE